MKIQVAGRKMTVGDHARDFAERKIISSMGRLSGHIARVRVQLSDVNGPKGGRDTECLVEVHFRSAGRLTAKVTAEDFYSAVSRAAERAGYAVSQRVKRAHSFDRMPVRVFVGQAGESQAVAQSAAAI